MNHFQLDYPGRLQAWVELRSRLQSQTLEQQCLAVDAWWQYAPLINNYLHPLDTASWPTAWELLANNLYCTIARGLGMCYTLKLLGVEDIEMALADDDEHGDEHALVMVDHAKYILNTWPNNVVNNSLANYRIRRRLDCSQHINQTR